MKYIRITTGMNRPRSKMTKIAFAILTSLAVTSANAQEEQQTSDRGVKIEEVVVSGSRISRDGFSSPTPITSISTDDLQNQAATSIGDVLDDLPQFRNNISPRVNGVSSNNVGVSTADLRGLGANRTLVLVDSKRFPGSTQPSTATQSGAVDLNLIPSSIIKKVEVVTGGASASYGSDAVSGVVNILLDSDLQGTKVQTQFGETKYGDGTEYQASIAHGFDFADGRGHLTIAGEYVHNLGTSACNLSGRDWCVNSTNYVNNATRGVNGYPARVLVYDARVAPATEYGIIRSGPLMGTEFDAQGNPFNHDYGLYLGTGNYQDGGTSALNVFNAGTVSMAAETLRKVFFAHGNFEFSDKLNGSLDISYGDTTGSNNSTQYRATRGVTIQRDNAYLHPSVAARMDAEGVSSISVGLITTKFGVSQPNSNREVLRITAGLDGNFNFMDRDWSWDAYVSHSELDYNLAIYNASNTANIRRSIDAVIDPGTGNIVCRSTLTDPDNGCYAANPFGAVGPSDDARNYMTGTLRAETQQDQNVIAVNFQSDLFDLPAGPLTLAVGAEYREDDVSGEVDPIAAVSGWYGVSARSATGSADVTEAYVELAIPLLQDQTFAESLQANMAYRTTDYSISGEVDSWKAGLVWDVNGWLRIRATQSQDIRAPNLYELFLSRGSIDSSIIDPVSSFAGFVGAFSGGNPNLEAEIAETFTYGLVVQVPDDSMFSGLSFTVDYYDIDLENAITNGVGAQTTLNLCGNGVSSACSLITRNSAGEPLTVENGNVNLNTLDSRGIDYELKYLIGNLSLRVFGNRALSLATTTPDGTVIERAGQNGGNTANAGVPAWKLGSAISYDFNNLSLTARVMYIPEGIRDAQRVGPSQSGYDPYLANSVSDNTVGSATYIDLGARYTIETNSDSEYEVYALIDNAFDEEPPRNNEHESKLYDPMGRTYKVGLRAKF